MNKYPRSIEQKEEYSALSWDEAKGKYKYTETRTHYCTEEDVADFKKYWAAEKAREEAVNKTAVIAELNSKVVWADSGISLKPEKLEE